MLMMKKILFLINSLHSGGAEKLLIDLLKVFDYSKYDVTLFYFLKGGIYLKDIPQQVHAKCILKMGSRFDNLLRNCMQRFGQLDDYYRYQIRKAADQYDVIISFLEGFPARMHSYILDKGRQNISFIHTDLGSYNSSRKQFDTNNSQESVYNKMDKLVFVSNHAKNAFNKIYPDITTYQTVLPNFIDIDTILNKSIEYTVNKKGFTVITVGRLAPVKGIDLIPEIAKKIKDKGLSIHFNIIGDGTEKHRILELIRTMNVDDSVTLVGFKKNPYPYILNADLYINTSYTEGMPLSLCEAMLLGKPVIASKTAGASELLSDGSGIIIERDADLFSKWIYKLYQNDSLRHEYSKQAIRKAMTLDKDNYMSQFYNIM